VKGLKLEEEVAESLDAAMIGTIFHAVMFEIYASAFDGPVTRTDDGRSWIGMLDVPYKVSRRHMKTWHDDEPRIRKMVMGMIAESMKADHVSGRNLVIADVIVRYVLKTLDRDIEYLDDNSTDSLMIYGLEVPLNINMDGQKIKGLVDRVDAVREGVIRVVDYKTGKVMQDDYEINDETYQRIAENIFAEDVEERPGIAFQFYIYDLLLRTEGHDSGRQMKNSIYSMATIFKEEPKTRDLHDGFYQMMTESLKCVLEQMYDLRVPFRRTQEKSACTYCDFKNICGR
jgi:ATP-dependent helicase/DNAse subunit B